MTEDATPLPDPEPDDVTYDGSYVLITQVPSRDASRSTAEPEQTYTVDSRSLDEDVIPAPPDPVALQLSPPDPAARPLWRVSDWSISPEHRLLEIVDSELEFGSSRRFPDDEDWVLNADGWILLTSAGLIHTPEITFEAWETAPPADDQMWDRQIGMVAVFPSSGFYVQATTSGVSLAPAMRLPYTEDGRYYLRLQVRGSAEAEAISDAAIDNDDALFPVGIEQWRLQFWPVNPSSD